MDRKVLLSVFGVLILLGALAYFFTSEDFKSINQSEPVVLAVTEERKSALGINPNDRYELIDLLKAKRFVELNEKLQNYEQQLEVSAISEFDLKYIYLSFRFVDPSLESLFKGWESSNTSWSSKFAYANYLYKMAWEWRGKSSWNSVPKLNQDKFKELMVQAETLAMPLMNKQRKSALLVDFLIAVANDGANQNEEEVIANGFAMFPKSESIYRAAIRSSASRWGGDQFVRTKLIADLDQLLSQETGKTETGLVDYYNAYDAYKNKNYLTAINDYKRAIKYNPAPTQYHLGISDAYFQNKQYEQALEHINIVINDWPSSNNIRLKRAKILLRLDQNVDAQEDINLALQLSPFDAELNKQAAELYGKLGNKEQAIKALETSIYFKQESSDWWGRIGSIAQRQIKDLALAEQHYKKALEVKPYDVRAAYGLSTLYADSQSCGIVQSLHDYMTGCQRGVGKTRFWCRSRYTNWARSSVNHLQGSQTCPTINEFDFSVFN